jgi:tripeptidyl-peptidase-1
VSANGAWTHIYINGTLYRYGGTSMATPLFASIINIINDQRIAAGKSTVGFVNPTFYANPQAFTDM